MFDRALINYSTLTSRFVDQDYIPSNALDLVELRNQLCASVRRHLLAEVPFGLLLSGGLDSSLVRIIMKERRTNKPRNDRLTA